MVGTGYKDWIRKLHTFLKMKSTTADIQELFTTSPTIFFGELHSELSYYLRTKVITMFDVYRIRKRLLPLLDVWISSQNRSYESYLNTHEGIVLEAMREESNLSDATQMANENKYIVTSK